MCFIQIGIFCRYAILKYLSSGVTNDLWNFSLLKKCKFNVDHVQQGDWLVELTLCIEFWNIYHISSFITQGGNWPMVLIPSYEVMKVVYCWEIVCIGIRL